MAIIERAAPYGIALFKSWLKGKEVLVVGQARAGKTTFIDYLHYGIFEDEKETSKTLDKHPSPRFNIKMGRDSALELSVKTVVDIPGQWGPMAHADLVFARRPQSVIIVLDATAPLTKEPLGSEPWLREFCRHLENNWRAKGKSRNRLKCLIVLLNKIDKATAKAIDIRKKAFRKVLDTELHTARGKMIEDIAIVPCVLVTNSNGTKSVDSAIAHLAKALTKES